MMEIIHSYFIMVMLGCIDYYKKSVQGPSISAFIKHLTKAIIIALLYFIFNQTDCSTSSVALSTFRWLQLLWLLLIKKSICFTNGMFM